MGNRTYDPPCHEKLSVSKDLTQTKVAIPSNWHDLRDAVQPRLDEDLRQLKLDHKRATRVLDREVPTLAGAFTGSPEYLARVLALRGAERAQSECYLLHEALPRLLAYGDETPKQAPTSAVSVLSYIALMRCLDRPLPDQAEGIEARWLRLIAPRPDRLNDFGVRTAALAAVAVGAVDLVPPLDGGGPLHPRSEPQKIAGANVAGFTRHLAEVVKGGGGIEAVEGPWWSFLRMFPLVWAARGVRWIDILWASMAVMVHFEKRPPAAVGIWLPKLIAELD